MTLNFSDPIPPQTRGDGRALAVQSFDLSAQGPSQSPIVMFDDFRVRGHPFAPHPHAGFSAITYVFDDSVGDLRSRDSLGNDYIVSRGGIVWTQAANGIMHEEMLADPSLELHGLQVFVNLSGDNKSIPAQVFALDGEDVPIWSDSGARVHIVVGDYAGTESPLRPAEPFRWLDIERLNTIDLAHTEGWAGLIYARYDDIHISHARGRLRLPKGMMISVEGGGAFRLESTGKARALFLSGQAVVEPMLQHGPFIMRNTDQINAAARRYQRGEMGQLAPYQR